MYCAAERSPATERDRRHSQDHMNLATEVTTLIGTVGLVSQNAGSSRDYGSCLDMTINMFFLLFNKCSHFQFRLLSH